MAERLVPRLAPAACAPTPQTDPENCGQCGNVCRIIDPDFDLACPEAGCCAGGVCAPAFAECIEETDGFITCAEYCSSIGESCTQSGCFNELRTWVGFVDDVDCTAFGAVDSGTSGACDEPLDWTNPDSGTVRCCCTDTQRWSLNKRYTRASKRHR
jgi:hypothetical protein